MSLTPPSALQHALESAWARSDRIFELLLPGALLEQPIPLRHPFLFYVGHLPAFAWNQLCRGALGQTSLQPELDDLFARGIDPRDTEGPALGAARGSSAIRWPDEQRVHDYRDRARDAVRAALDVLPAAATRRALLVLEHELMHHETLLYMLQALDHGCKRTPAPPSAPSALAGTSGASATSAASGSSGSTGPSVPPPRRSLQIAAGLARLGATPGSLAFGWDNEFPEHAVEVPAFELDDRPVTNAEFNEFVQQGGYARRELWSAEAWAWLAARGAQHPHGWRRAGEAWTVRAPFADVAWEQARHWPASVTWAEASAFARQQGRRLLTEAEFHRAAYGDSPPPPAPPLSSSRSASSSPSPSPSPRHAGHANLDFERWTPQPVCSQPEARSPAGIHELIGNGWEWTATPLQPFPGFRADLPDYAGYSADFFDGRHYVLLGGSWATDRLLVRRSFRNWYQPHYPYAFTKFRTAGPA